MVNTSFALEFTTHVNCDAKSVFTIYAFDFLLVCTFLCFICLEQIFAKL